MRDGAVALMSFVALALVGVNLTRPAAVHESGAPSALESNAASAALRADEQVALTTRARALRLLADHWGMALRATSTRIVELKQERPGPRPKAGGTAKVTETESRTKDPAREIEPPDARLVEARFREVGGRVLIATIPDPLDSDLALDFDRYLEAVEQAAGARGFVPDRHDLPWKQTGDTPAADARPEGGRHRSEPGLVLFRELDGPRLLLLAVVGETPIQGIQKLAFRNALLLARCLNGPHARLTVVGPALSGSVPSIRLELEGTLAGLSPAPEVHFIATTATRDKNQDELQRLYRGLTVRYRAAVHPNRVSFEALEAYLAERGYPGLSRDDGGERRLAILSESSSAYGSLRPDGNKAQAEAEAEPEPALSPSPSHAPKEESSEPTCRPAPAGKSRIVAPASGVEPLAFRYDCFSFPMQIAQLRAAYEREQLTGRRGIKATAPPSALQLSYGSASSNRERTPVYATTLSANAAERVLLNTFDAIARQRIRYVIVIATDVRDRLFVVQLARRWLPDVQLISFDTDVLLTHPDLAVEAEGLLTVSSYPLALGATRASDKAYRNFPSPGAAAYFNASTALLDELLPVATPGRQIPDDALSFIGLDAAPGGGTGYQPRVWVSVINHMQEWPLASYAPDAGVATFFEQRAGGPAVASRFVTSAGQKGHIVFVGIIALLALTCLAALASFPSRGSAPPLIRRSALVAFRAAPAWLLLLLASGLALWIWPPEPKAAWAAASVTCLIGSAIAWAPFPDVEIRRVLHAAAASVIVAIVAVTIWPHVNEAKPVALVDLRWFVLGSGIEPRVPLVLAAGAIVVLLLAQPLQGTDRRHFDALNPFPPSNAGRAGRLTSGFGEFHELIAEELFWSPRARFVRYSLVAAAAIGAGAVLNAPYAHLRGLDGRGYDLAASGLLTVGFLFVVASGLQAWCIWRRVRQLLRRLTWHPLHAAFDRLPERLAHDLGLKGSLRFAPVSALGFCIEQAGMAANHLDSMSGKAIPNAAINSAMGPTRALRQKAHLHGWAFKFRREIRQAESARRSRRAVDSATIGRLLEVSRCLFDCLFQVWDARPLATGLLGGATHGWPKDVRGPDGREPHTVHVYRTYVPDEFHVWVRLCEDFVAAMTVAYLRFVFVTLKRLLLGVVAATILLLFATVSYPFGPRGSLTVGALMLVAGLIGLLLMLIVQTERDAILSRVANTAPNKVTFSSQLVMQFALYVCAPAAIAVTTQFPRLRDSVGRFIDPILKVIQG